MADELTELEQQAKEQAVIVLGNLVDSLSNHFKPLSKSQARAIVRQALQEI